MKIKKTSNRGVKEAVQQLTESFKEATGHTANIKVVKQRKRTYGRTIVKEISGTFGKYSLRVRDLTYGRSNQAFTVNANAPNKQSARIAVAEKFPLPRYRVSTKVLRLREPSKVS